MRLRRLLPAVVLAASMVALGGCSAVTDLFGGDQAVRDEDSGEVTDGGRGDVFALAVGDCLDDEEATEVTDVPLTPCSEPHDDEVYYDFSLTGSAYPGDDEVASAADDGCYDAFAGFVGVPYEESELDFSYFTPTRGSWGGGDRIVSCIVYDPAGKTTGSLAGAAR